MLILHSVTKELGRGRQKVLVLDDIDLVIPQGTRLAILGQSGSGKTTFLKILSGSLFPTSGWVERRAIVSTTESLARHGSVLTTPRQLAHRLASLYRADGDEISRFIEHFADLSAVMDVPVKLLTRKTVNDLNLALYYALPCDFYLFDQSFQSRSASLKRRASAAFQQRQKEAGTILATSSPQTALEFGGIGAILFRGRLTFFKSVIEAANIFEQLQIEYPVTLKKPLPRKLSVEES